MTDDLVDHLRRAGEGKARMLREEIALVGERIAQQAANLDAATHRLLVDIRLFDAQCGWYEEGARSCAAWLAWRLGWTPSTARERLRVARALGEWPAIDNALRRGLISYSKVRAITRVVTAANVASLIEYACSMTAAELERFCADIHRARRLTSGDPVLLSRRRRVVRRTLESGMVKIVAVLPPEEAALVWEAIEAAGCDRADGLVALACNTAAERRSRPPVEVVVDASAESSAGHVPDQEELRPAAGASANPPPIATQARVVHKTSRRVSVPVVVRPSGVVPDGLWRGLPDRDRACCFPGCDSRAVVEGHCLEPWPGTGMRSIDERVLLCRHHYRFVHDHGIRVYLDGKRPEFHDRNNRPIERVPSRPSPDVFRWSAIPTPEREVPSDSIQRCRRAAATGAASEVSGTGSG